MLVFLLFTKESESDYMLTIETKELNKSETYQYLNKILNTLIP